ncbi:MAG: hypothetical protein AAF216_03095 [Pseudomonadota bacterium]
MPDRLFFPLAAILAGLLVVLAMQPALGALPSGAWSGGDSDYRDMRLNGLDLNRISSGGEAQINLVTDSDPIYLEIETAVGDLSDDPLLGPHVRISEDIELANSGHIVEVSVVARAGERLGAEQMLINYSTGREGESGWQSFNLTREWATYSFTYEVPLKTGERALDYFAIRPVTPEKTRSLWVSEFRMQRIRPWTTDDPQG